MKRRKINALAFGIFVGGGLLISSLTGCTNPEGIKEGQFELELVYDSSLGQVNASALSGKGGDVVTITITPNENVKIESIIVNGETRESVETSFEFVTSDGKNTVEVKFKDENAPEPLDTSFTVRAVYDSTKGMVSLNKTEGEDYASDDAIITVTIDPKDGCTIESVKINGQVQSEIKTSYMFQAQLGENIVEVVFAGEPTPVDPSENKFNFVLDFDSTKGNVTLSETSGDWSEGKKVNLNVTPKSGFIVSSVLHNNNDLGISADGKYEISVAKGENIVKVQFVEKGSEIGDRFTLELKYDSSKGKVQAEKTQGAWSEGLTINVNVQPNQLYYVKSIKFNGESLAIDNVSNIYKLPVVKGANVFEVEFELKAEDPSTKKFTIDLVVNNEEGGSASVDKTEGEVGEKIILTIRANSGYFPYVTFNGTTLEIKSEQTELSPVAGRNKIVVTFSNGEESMLEEFARGFEVTKTYEPILGTCEVSKDDFTSYFLEMSAQIDSNSAASTKTYFEEFYDDIISKTALTEETFAKIKANFTSEDLSAIIKATSSGFILETIEQVISVIIPVINNLTEQEFSIVLYDFLALSLNSSMNSVYTNTSYHGISVSALDRAAQYFASIGNQALADKISTFDTTYKKKETLNETFLVELEKFCQVGGKFLYGLVKELLAYDNNPESLAEKIFSVVNLFNDFSDNPQAFFDQVNREKNLKTIQVLGTILYDCLPSLDTWNFLMDEFEKYSSAFDSFFEFLGISGSSSYTNRSISYQGNNVKSVISALNDGGDELYYTLKFIGYTIKNCSLEDYNAILDTVYAMMSSQNQDQTTMISSIVKASKIVVENLVAMGSDAEYIKNGFAKAFEVFGKIQNYSSKAIVDGYGSIYNLSFSNVDNAFVGYDFAKVSEFVTFACGLNEQEITKEDINIINQFIGEIQNSMKNSGSSQYRDVYQIIVNNQGKEGQEFIEVISEPTSSKIDFSSVTGVNFDYENMGVGVIDNVYGGKLYISYNNASLKYVDYDFYLSILSSNVVNQLVVPVGYEFTDEDYLLYRQEGDESTAIKLKDLSLDTSSVGLKYATFKDETGEFYIFEYGVYEESDVEYSYYVDSPIIENAPDYIKDYSIVESRSLYIDDVYFYFGSQDVEIVKGTFDVSSPGRKKSEFVVKGYENKEKTITLEYLVYEYLSLEANLECSYDDAEFYFEGKELDNSKPYYFYGEYTLNYRDPESGRESQEWDYQDFDLCANDFEYGLDNSTSGFKTDYYTDENGLRWSFDYEVYELIDGDLDYTYYVDDPYVTGIGLLNGTNYSSLTKAKREYYRNSLGEERSFVEKDYTKDYYGEIRTNGISLEPGTHLINVRLDSGEDVEAKIVVSDYQPIGFEYHSNIDRFIIGDLPDDNETMIFNVYETLLVNTWEYSNWEISHNLADIQTEFKYIKDSLNLEEEGEHTTILKFDECPEFEYKYSVYALRDANLGSTYSFTDNLKETVAYKLSEFGESNYVRITAYNCDIQILSECNYEVSREGDIGYFLIDTKDLESLNFVANYYNIEDKPYFTIEEVSPEEIYYSESGCYISGHFQDEKGDYIEVIVDVAYEINIGNEIRYFKDQYIGRLNINDIKEEVIANDYVYEYTFTYRGIEKTIEIDFRGREYLFEEQA